MMSNSSDKIELLNVDLLDNHRSRVNELKRLARQLGIEFGWHYLLDLTWILSQLRVIQGQQILDAGAGTGILQWYLVEKGARVISVDRMSRAFLPLHFRWRYRVNGLRPTDLQPTIRLSYPGGHELAVISAKFIGVVKSLTRVGIPQRNKGSVIIYNQDLTDLCDLDDNSIDAVVAVSALEHNTPPELELVVNELMRVLKPGGVLLATLAATNASDWFHAPSRGWCFSESSLRKSFQLSPVVPSNFAEYNQLFVDMSNNHELRDNLASFYFQSGDNGMPWGKWDPQYLPVGICKVKQ